MLHTRLLYVPMSAMFVAAMFVFSVGSDCLRAADEPANPPARIRGQRMGPGASGLELLQLEVVTKDLGLTDEQTTSLKKISEDAHQQMTELRDSLKDTPRAERQPKIAEAEKEIAKKVDALLNDKQRARMQEIKLQVRGPSALRETEVADALKLTDDQKKKLNEIAEERRTAIRAAIKEVGGPAQLGQDSPAREKIGKIAKDSAEEMEKVLTTEQSEQFEKMKGAKLDLGNVPFGALGGAGRRPTGSDSKPQSKPDSK